MKWSSGDPSEAAKLILKNNVPVAPAPTASAWLEQHVAIYGAGKSGNFILDDTMVTLAEVLAAYASSQSEKGAAEIERLSKEIENLIWNLGGCDTIASGWSKPFDYNKEMARPALDSVSRLATKLEAAESKLSQLQLSNETLKQKLQQQKAEIIRVRRELGEIQTRNEKSDGLGILGMTIWMRARLYDVENEIVAILNGGQQ